MYEKCNDTADFVKLRSKFKDIPELIQYYLPNVGGEGHTWLDFILSKQSLFGDLNLFIQAGPHISVAKIPGKIKDFIKRKMEFSSFTVGDCTRLENSVSPKAFPYRLEE